MLPPLSEGFMTRFVSLIKLNQLHRNIADAAGHAHTRWWQVCMRGNAGVLAACMGCHERSAGGRKRWHQSCWSPKSRRSKSAMVSAGDIHTSHPRGNVWGAQAGSREYKGDCSSQERTWKGTSGKKKKGFFCGCLKKKCKRNTNVYRSPNTVMYPE